MRIMRVMTVVFIGVLIVLSACAKPASTTPTPPTIPTTPITPTTPTTPATPTTPTTPTTPAIPATPATPTTPVTQGPNEVWVQGFSFNPATITVKVGTTVSWTNKDNDQHDVTSDTGIFSRQIILGGPSFNYTFDKPGTYNYVCGVHPGMTGKVIVQ